MIEINFEKVFYEDTCKEIDRLIERLTADAKTSQDTAYIEGLLRAKGILIQSYNRLQSADE